MGVQILTMSTKGQVVIPAEVRGQLGIEPGTKLSMSVEGSRIILQPMLKVIEELCGITKGGPSMADALIAERQEDERRWQERRSEK